MTTKCWCWLLLLLLLPLALVAQQRNGINLSGRALTPADLEAKGASVVLLFDDLNTNVVSTAWAHAAARKFLSQHAPKATYTLLTTSGALKVTATSDTASLLTALNRLSSHAEQILPTSAAALNGMTEAMHGGGSNDESLENQSRRSIDTYAHAIAYASSLPGPATLVIISTGFPVDFPANGSNLETQVHALDLQASASGVIINVMDPASLDPANASTSNWQLQEAVLNGLTQVTGGRLIDNRNELTQAFPELVASRQARDAAKKFRQALAGTAMHELPVEVVPRPWKSTRKAPDGMYLVVLISPKGMQFDKQGGHHRARLRVAAVLSDSHGHWISAREGDAVLNLSDSDLQALTRNDIQLGLQVPAPPAHYHLVLAAQEIGSGATTSLSTNLTLH